jgi:hypothetical protein
MIRGCSLVVIDKVCALLAEIMKLCQNVTYVILFKKRAGVNCSDNFVGIF